MLLTILTVAAIVLKLAGVIDWSWWLVLSPLYATVLVLIYTAVRLYQILRDPSEVSELLCEALKEVGPP